MESALTADEQAAYYDFTVDNDPQITRARSTVNTMLGGAAAGSTGNDAGENAGGEDQSAAPEGEDEGDTGEAVVPEDEGQAADGE